MKRTRIDLTGQQFGHLTALEFVKVHKGATLWRFRCSCGKEVVVNGAPVRTGKQKSCGCVGNRIAPGLAGKHRVFKRYKATAEQRDLDFALSFDEVVRLTSSPCTYCGIPPTQLSTYDESISADARAHAAYHYNGIDRVDNALGYIAGNVVPCCKICNIAKRDLSKESFLSWIARAFLHNNLEAM